MDLERTIVALSSGVGAAPRAVVRISGQLTASILDQLLKDSEGKQRVLSASSAVCARCDARISFVQSPEDRWVPVSCYFWPDQRSFTGETCAELHLVGSMPIAERLIESIIALGARSAQRGEFAMRSFLSGKIDLTQVEAVLGVIEADDEQELAYALGQLGGNISAPVRELRNELLELTAHLEAGLDFVEEDIEFISQAALVDSLQTIIARLEQISHQLVTRGSRSRVAKVVLVGQPNAGKSSLFNALLGTSRAIVSEQAGTTRDAISAMLQLGETQIELVDTAGVEEISEASPRGLAQVALRNRLSDADVILHCVDLSLQDAQSQVEAEASLLPAGRTVVRVGTKLDIACDAAASDCHAKISSRRPESLGNLQTLISVALETSRRDSHATALHATMLRCGQAIDAARSALERAIDYCVDQIGEELVAAELRVAIDDLSSVIGEVHTEDILGEIFSRFCIGK